jgi:RES domain-containing protein
MWPNVDRAALPARWRRDPPPAELAFVGDAWIRERRSPVLAVPSAIVDEELNYLLNPRHTHFS